MIAKEVNSNYIVIFITKYKIKSITIKDNNNYEFIIILKMISTKVYVYNYAFGTSNNLFFISHYAICKKKHICNKIIKDTT